MPEPVQPTEGLALLQHQLVLSQSKRLLFDSSRVVFVDAEFKDDVYGVGTGLHTFRTADPNFLDAVKQAMSDANPIMQFRLGFGSPNNMFWLPWQEHVIVKYYAKYEGIGTSAGHLLVFKTDNSLTRFERSNKVIVRKGTIAEIVQAIAAENNLQFVVEPTDEKFMLYQTFQDDTRFIRERLLCRAITKTGRGGFYFFIRDNVLHFHTADYQSTARQMNYYNSFGRELTITDISQDPELWDSGVAGIRVISHNPNTGETKEIESDPNKALRLAESLYQFGNVINGQWNVPYHASFNPTIEANAIAQFSYQRSRQRIFKCSLTIDKTIAIRHGDLLNLSITQTQKASSHSGLYYVTSAAHIVKKQAITSVYTLERGEVRGQDQSLSAQNAQRQLVPESKAPGEDPNILEIQSSEQTKGSGNQSSSKTFTAVTDANTGQPLG